MQFYGRFSSRNKKVNLKKYQKLKKIEREKDLKIKTFLEEIQCMELSIKRMGEHDLPLPKKAHWSDAAFDLTNAEGDIILEASEQTLIPTGFAWDIPEGFCGIIKPRSGMAVKAGIDVLAGVVDAGYRGEIKVALINHGLNPINIEFGTRIAQLILFKIPHFDLTLVKEFPEETARGSGGFGSTGEK